MQLTWLDLSFSQAHTLPYIIICKFEQMVLVAFQYYTLAGGRDWDSKKHFKYIPLHGHCVDNREENEQCSCRHNNIANRFAKPFVLISNSCRESHSCTDDNAKYNNFIMCVTAIIYLNIHISVYTTKLSMCLMSIFCLVAKILVSLNYICLHNFHLTNMHGHHLVSVRVY